MDKVVPVLQIDDFDIAKEFYVEGLEFELEFAWQHELGFPIFAGVTKGKIELNLSEHGKGHSGSEIYIYVDDISIWHQRCLRNKIKVESEPQKQPWGAIEMLIVDPFRNALRFSQPDNVND